MIAKQTAEERERVRERGGERRKEKERKRERMREREREERERERKRERENKLVVEYAVGQKEVYSLEGRWMRERQRESKVWCGV